MRLFYSYSHKDGRHRENMQDTLSLLRRGGLLADWSDLSIVPGKSISKSIRREMERSDIMAFLLSRNFIASDACIEEWNNAKRASTSRPIVRLPIILSDCAWQDLLDDEDLKALPNDANPVSKFAHRDEAWQQVYDGIKAVIEDLRTTYSPNPRFVSNLQTTDFPSQRRVELKDTFVFPSLSYYARTRGGQLREDLATEISHILDKKRVLIHGPEMSGKTTLARHFYLEIIKQSRPVLFVDLQKLSEKRIGQLIIDAYQEQFAGDYASWTQQDGKTIVLDNLSSAARAIDFVEYAKEHFDRVIVTCQSAVFNAYFSDDDRLAGFTKLSIEPLTHRQQEKLIRNRIKLMDDQESMTDGYVDQIERHVNSVIISKRIVPRYPFFVLSILQTYESFIPDTHITSYGHCYYVLIISNLIKSGIPRTDDAINMSFQFAEHLAFHIHTSGGDTALWDFDSFAREYRDTYILPASILNRLQDDEYGIIAGDGKFRTSYMYYYFLGRFLARNSSEQKDTIEAMSTRCHVSANYLTLLFIIHHAEDGWIVEDVLLRVMCAFDSVEPAKLGSDETARFGDIVDALSENILSEGDVGEERGRERDIRELQDSVEEEIYGLQNGEDGGVAGEWTTTGFGSECYQAFKSNEILGQILRNKYGTLEKRKVEQIVETIADGGLRVVNALLKDEKEIANRAQRLHRELPEYELEELRDVLRGISFLWTIANIEMIVGEINHPEIRSVVAKLVKRKGTPAYDLIEYFSRLDGSNELTDGVRDLLRALLKRHSDKFVQNVLSIRTQRYLNTHRSSQRVEQSVCSLLGIRYAARAS